MPLSDRTVETYEIINKTRDRDINRPLYKIFRILRISFTLMAFISVFSLPAAEMEESDTTSSTNQQQQNQNKFKVSVNVNLVTTDVRVIGKSLSALRAEDFKIYDDKVAQEVTLFSYDQLPVAVAILIDKSGSVRPYFPMLKIASLLALKQLKPEDQVALFSFSDSCNRDVELTTDRLLIAKEISKLKIVSETELFNALYKTAQYLGKKAKDRRRAIILVSDNVGEMDNRDIKRALNEVLESYVTLYSIQTTDNPAASGNVSNDKVKEIVDKSGGELLNVDAPTSLQAALKKAITSIRYQYTLGFSPSAPGETGSYHPLGIQLTNPERCPECRLLTRKGYYSGVSPTVTQTDEAQQVLPVTTEETNELLIQRIILTAGTTELDLPDIPFTVETDEYKAQNGQSEIDIHLKIDPSGIGFKTVNGRQDFDLYITVFYADDKGKVLGQDWKRLESGFGKANNRRILKEGILFNTTVPRKAKKQWLKIVVYDEVSNKIASKLIKNP